MMHEDDLIREALWPEAGVDAETHTRFTAAVLFRLGQRRRMMRHAWRLLSLAGLAGSAAVLARPIVRGLAPLQAGIDLPALAAGLLLLAFCAVLAPSRA